MNTVIFCRTVSSIESKAVQRLLEKAKIPFATLYVDGGETAVLCGGHSFKGLSMIRSFVNVCKNPQIILDNLSDGIILF